ncbi:hypothetical protein H5410_002141 [Solanum commersonii]|uniref:Uncharacterized protein n=1 Tax=Solanum commersonii TaxID=4109 RepID=A0A9J6B155_SOLCO|nr:hypothetical protein H5410_002141 [Solanum commersonii]
MLNDEFDVVDMNNHNDEIGKDEVLDFESNNPHTPIVGNNIPCPSTRDMSNQLRTELGCKVSYWKIYKGMEHVKSSVREHMSTSKAYDRCEFNDHFNQIRDLVPKAAETLEHIGFHTWSREFFSKNRYNIMTSNNAESVTTMFDVERKFSIVSLFDEINRRFALLFY